jgi:hypothetical protein
VPDSEDQEADILPALFFTCAVILDGEDHEAGILPALFN